MTLPSTQEILTSPCTSYWLKAAIKANLNRDCLDALRDAEVLTEVLRRHYQTVTGRQP